MKFLFLSKEEVESIIEKSLQMETKHEVACELKFDEKEGTEIIRIKENDDERMVKLSEMFEHIGNHYGEKIHKYDVDEFMDLGEGFIFFIKQE